MRKAAGQLARYWRGRSYRTAPQIKVRLSPARLANIYYLWRQSGKDPASLALNYKARPAAAAPEQIARFLLECAAPGVCSMKAAWRRANVTGISIRALVGGLPAGARAVIGVAHWERRELAAEETRIGRRIRRLAARTL